MFDNDLEYEGVKWRDSSDLFKDIKFNRDKEPKIKKNEDLLFG